MANIVETDNWPGGVYQYADGDVLQGGPDSSEVLPLKQLAQRSLYQRLRNVTDWDAGLADEFGYPAGAVVRHSAVSWRAKVANDVEPGTDVTKWERWGFTIAEIPHLDEVVNNTYIGPEPTKQRVFTNGEVLLDMPAMGTSYVCQTLNFTGARRVRINGHAAFQNNASLSCNVTMTLKINGSGAPFGGHYLGAILTAQDGANLTQIPISITDYLSGLDPSENYTLTLEATKQQVVGPIKVLDAYLDIEFV